MSLASNTVIETHLSQCDGKAKTAAFPWTPEAPYESSESIRCVLSVEGIDRGFHVEFDLWARLKILLEALEGADEFCRGRYPFFFSVR